jgi:glycosyltransferase involved in cell wall biosynthesis
MKNEIKIACLPVAGIGNPYQFLMIKGLNSGAEIMAVSGIDDRFFGILRTAIKIMPTYIHFDWIISFYYRRSLWMTILSIPLFMIQLLFVKHILNIKLVWTLHNIQPHDSNHHKIHSFCRRFFAKQCTWIRIFSEDSLERAHKALNIKNKFIICPEGSYVEYYKNTISFKEARQELNINEESFVYLYLGFIKPYKGIENLIENFKRLEINNKKLIIAGNVLNKKYFDEIYTKDNDILFVNRFIENDDLQNFYKSADVVVLPFNKVENSGSVILAMGFKKVIVAPKMGVLLKRLANQLDFLYEEGELFQKLELAHKKKNTLNEYGELNFEELKKDSWTGFKKYYK